MLLNHNPSPVSLCLKSGDLGFFLPNLLSHHLFRFSTKFFQESSPFVPSTRFSVTNFTSNSFVSPTSSPPSTFDWGNLDKAHSGMLLNHNPSPVSLCLKSGDLGYFLPNLLSHHLYGIFPFCTLNSIFCFANPFTTLRQPGSQELNSLRNPEGSTVKPKPISRILVLKVGVSFFDQTIRLVTTIIPPLFWAFQKIPPQIQLEPCGTHSQRNINTIVLLKATGQLSQFAFVHNGNQPSFTPGKHFTPGVIIRRNQNRGKAFPIGVGLEMGRGFHAADQIHGVANTRSERNLSEQNIYCRIFPFVDLHWRKARIGGLLGSEILCGLLGYGAEQSGFGTV
ncbi:hypothetical protein STAS_18068 [Striga asiatica]|uniref:Uncharacterized protein n=1 Tax=Striga asiatica TaxID=4170 RepID=A0A5A7Q8I5_STRAF|nr:hypothetical protein STAS_18068 [Striga asiatica]